MLPRESDQPEINESQVAFCKTSYTLIPYLGTWVLALKTHNKIADFLILLATINENFVLRVKEQNEILLNHVKLRLNNSRRDFSHNYTKI